MSRTQAYWFIGVGGTYIQPQGVNGFDLLVYGTNHYLNFGTLSGSTGYGIRDNSGTMEFKNSAGAWTGIGSGGASSPLTTKGDIYTFTTLDARLPVGTNGQALTADSAEATGLKWVTLGAGTGDMILAAAQTVTGLKTFNDTKFALRNVADTFSASFVNTITANRIFTLPDTAGTVALGTGTINEIAYWAGTNTLGTLAVATYPSLTELSYVKGVTSAIQTQLAARALTATTITINGTANQITSSAGAQDLSANRTWTLSLPADVLIPTVLTVPNSGLHILDTNASHDLIITPGSDLTADRILTITTGDSARTLTMTGDASISGTNTGDQSSIVGITGTKAQFDTAVTDGNFLYVGDITQYTDELAQDAVGAMIDTTLEYVDATPLLKRAALTGAITASSGSNTTALGSFTKSQLDTAVSDGNVLYVGDVTQYTDEMAQDAVGTILANSTFVSLTYSDATPSITGSLSATGTPSSSTFLRGDNTWATPAGSGDVTKVGTPVNNQLGVWTGDGTIEGDSALTFDTATDTLNIGNVFYDGSGSIYTNDAATPTDINITTGDATSGTNEGGDLIISLGNGSNASGGDFEVYTGNGGTSADGGYMYFIAGNGGATSGNGGYIYFEAGHGTAGNSNGGNIDLIAGAKFGSGTSGFVDLETESGKLRLNGALFSPQTSDTVALGSGTLMWSDLFLASGGVLNFNNGNATVTHSAGLLTSNVDIAVPDEAYGVGWNGSLEVPTKNAIYDKIETIVAGTSIDYTTNFLFMGA
jgi:hypothetical protein